MNQKVKYFEAFFHKAILLFGVSLFSFCSYAQPKYGKNLVPNPGFETHKNKANSITNAVPWRNVGTVDYYMKPDKKDTSKFKGARTGTCYGGLRFQPEYKEYMYVGLNEPLKAGKIYYFKMFVRLLGQSTVTVKQLGVYFSPDVFQVGMVFDEEGLIDSTYKKGLSGSGWLAIQGEYHAHGGEKYIIIGNFKTKMKEDMVKRNKWEMFELREAYYFLDDVSVREKLVEIDSSANGNSGGEPKWIPYSFDTGLTFEIKNLFFEKGTSKLLSTSNKSLDDLAKALIEHPSAELQISGHMDKFGDETEEKRISKERAKAVYDYLKTKGVVNLMTFKGLGSSQPVAPNDSEEYKEKNRRIEIYIIKE